jgi:hypothetical protein
MVVLQCLSEIGYKKKISFTRHEEKNSLPAHSQTQSWVYLYMYVSGINDSQYHTVSATESIIKQLY